MQSDGRTDKRQMSILLDVLYVVSVKNQYEQSAVAKIKFYGITKII
jgi:hypothetical protein